MPRTIEELEKELELEKAKNNQTMSPEFMEMMKGVGDNMSAFAQSMGDLKTSLADLKPNTDKKPDPKPDENFINLEILDRKGFLDIIIDKVSSVMDTKLDDKIKPLNDDFRAEQEKTNNNSARKLVSAAKENHTDFMDWKDEIVQLVKTNPTLSPEDAYTLVRHSNPEKAKEMDEKYKSDEDKERETEEKATEERRLSGDDDITTRFGGGLTPTSGKTVQSDELTTDDAAETAWRRTFGSAKEV